MLMGFFSVAEVISSFAAAGKPYTSPAMKGEGLDMLWSVSNAYGFQVGAMVDSRAG
jgi:hypothetical protein